jgi:osmotically-inducible protein OsmY
MTVAKTPTQPNETIGEKIDDASITAQVKSSLMSHRSTSALRTKVATTDGVVTLSGTARNAAEKSLVTKLVTGINGVESVVNNMTIEAAVSGVISRPLPPQNLKVVIK